MGSVAEGRVADLVLLDANPLTDIHNTRRIRGVLLAGRYFDRAALRRMLQEVAKAAALPDNTPRNPS
jgi:cytosine/adenosine deaminase-related metal-dependent hydrolase